MLRPLAVAALVSSVGCGVPEAVYNAKVNALGRCENDATAYRAETTRRLGELSTSERELSRRNESLKADAARVEAERAQLAQNLQVTQRDLADLRRAHQLAIERNRSYRDVIARLRGLIADGHLSADVRRGRLIVRIPGDTLFDKDGTTLRDSGQQALRTVAAALREIADRDYLVAAYTGRLPAPPKFGSNWELSTARAVSVVMFLQASGVDPHRLAAAGYSEFDPLVEGSDEKAQAANNRVEIVVLPNPEELPQLDEIDTAPVSASTKQ